MSQGNLKQALQYASENPNSDFAKGLGKYIGEGKADEQAKNLGIDLTPIKNRFSPKQEVKDTSNSSIQNSTLTGRLTENASNIISETGKGVIDTLKKSGQEFQNIADRTGEQSPLSSVVQSAGQGIGTASNVFGKLLEGAFKLATTEKERKFAENILKSGFDKISNNSVAKNIGVGIKEIGDQYNALKQTNPELAGNIKAGLQIADGLLMVTGEKPAVKGLKEVEKIAESGAKGLEKGVSAVKNEINTVKGAIKDKLKTNKVVDSSLSPLDKALKDKATGITAENSDFATKHLSGSSLLSEYDKSSLLEINPKIGEKYLKVLKDSEKSRRNIGLFDQAVNDTSKAIGEYKKATSEVGSEIGRIKEKLSKTKLNDNSIEDIRNIKQDLIEKLKKNHVVLDKSGKQFELLKGGDSPLTLSDVKAINEDILQGLNNIDRKKSMDSLLLRMKRLDNKINFNKTGELSGDLQKLSKDIRSKLKKVRDSHLTKKEASQFSEYSNAQKFIKEFTKSPNKVKTLLNRFSSKYGGDSLKFAKEIKRVTGVDVSDYATLAKILTDVTQGTSRNRSILRQYMGDAAYDVVRLSPKGITKSTAKAIGKKVFNVDKLKEIEKALKYELPKLKKKGLGLDNVVVDNKLKRLSSDLIQQARKYKTADEFFNAQEKYYHGTQSYFKEFKKGNPVFLTKDKSFAQTYADEKGINDANIRIVEATPIKNHILKDKNINDIKSIIPDGSKISIIGEVGSRKFVDKEQYLKKLENILNKKDNIIKSKKNINHLMNYDKQSEIRTDLYRSGVVIKQPNLEEYIRKGNFSEIKDNDLLVSSLEKYHDELKKTITSKTHTIKNTWNLFEGKIKLPNGKELPFKDLIKQKGYDGIGFTENNDRTFMYFDPKNIKTKAQLKKIWKEANK